MYNNPKISCLCVTNNRVSYLKTAICCFDSQSYENKELVIVYLSSDTSTINFLDQLDHGFIKRICVENTDEIIEVELDNLEKIYFKNEKDFIEWKTKNNL